LNCYPDGLSSELHIRHFTTDEALFELDRYLDAAFRAGLTNVRIVHGKRGGILRRLVHDVLRKHPLVKSFRLGGYGEGGIGVTIVEMASD